MGTPGLSELTPGLAVMAT
uniref:Uncharacterized protein n=1 Tax=Anguilla anguilla TaxID=7936 RepID=A0A0E9TM47_ANGAN